MLQRTEPAARGFSSYGPATLEKIPQLAKLSKDQRLDIAAVANVLPFRVNDYVLDLIDWDDIPHDPIFQLTFPQRGMLEPDAFVTMRKLVRDGASRKELQVAARTFQSRMNPHPSGQMQLNVPTVDGETVPGVQHKYRETVLFFPTAGQTCHAYCTYCFRWAQFVGLEDLKFACSDPQVLVNYLRRHPEVTDVLFTGGDPLIMKTKVLRRFIEPLLSDELSHVRTIRLGTKATAYWPARFVHDADADDLLRLFEQVAERGRHLAVMSHYSHARELSTPLAQEALRRILATGAVVRCQAPLIRHVNDHPQAWADLWTAQVAHGAVPYYLFVERDTGPKNYFEVPLAHALDIYLNAFQRVSGLARTARGPSMSATPGKVLVDGVANLRGEKVFVLKFLQARDPRWVERVFFARFDREATWLDELRPAQGESEFFFQPHLREMRRRPEMARWVRPPRGQGRDERRSSPWMASS